MTCSTTGLHSEQLLLHFIYFVYNITSPVTSPKEFYLGRLLLRPAINDFFFYKVISAATLSTIFYCSNFFLGVLSGATSSTACYLQRLFLWTATCIYRSSFCIYILLPPTPSPISKPFKEFKRDLMPQEIRRLQFKIKHPVCIHRQG